MLFLATSYDPFKKVQSSRRTVSVLMQTLVCVFRLHNAVQAKQKDKQTVGQLEKRLKAEQEARAAAEKLLAEEKKRKKLEEVAAARAVALAAATRCSWHTFPSFHCISFPNIYSIICCAFHSIPVHFIMPFKSFSFFLVNFLYFFKGSMDALNWSEVKSVDFHYYRNIYISNKWCLFIKESCWMERIIYRSQVWD